MYPINKQQQYREWQLLKAVWYNARFYAIHTTRSITTKVSVKKCDVFLEKCVLHLGWTIGEILEDYQKRRKQTQKNDL